MRASQRCNGETPVDHIPLTYIEKSRLHTNDLYCVLYRARDTRRSAAGRGRTRAEKWKMSDIFAVQRAERCAIPFSPS